MVLCLVPSDINDLSTRGGFGEERFDNASFQTRVLANYRRLANHLEKKRENGEAAPLWKWITVGKSSITEVLQMLLDSVQEFSNGMKESLVPAS